MNAQTKPDILFIVLDTLRADRLSCYGYPQTTTPNIDAFSESGVLYERAISPAQWTIPAHASLFTGEYPTTHMTTQIYDRHSQEQVTLAELLKEHGYATAGFCNNPLLGVVDNDLDRGFEEFYNYGGAFPERPPIGDARPRRLGRILQHVFRTLRKITAPIQNALAHNDALLRIALHPWIVPLWQGSINFKGNTRQSLRDVVGYLRTRRTRGAERPLFAFVNLMEAHLPFWPPARFIRRFAPYYRNNREAHDFMQRYNEEHYRWMVPLKEPLNEMQDRVIKDMYAAEIAYQDHLMRNLFEYLDEPDVRDNTLVVLTSDHGEGLNHHNFVGHSLVAYDDLIRVPLIVRYPQLYREGARVTHPISTRRIFHSALEAAGIFPDSNTGSHAPKGAPVDVETMSLTHDITGQDPERGTIFTEAYTPDTLLRLMEAQDVDAIETFRCRSMRRAAYRGDYKLITVGDRPDELFNVAADPGEKRNILEQEPDVAAELYSTVTDFVTAAESRRPSNWEMAQLHIEADAELADRLRGLGYIE